MKNVRLEDIAKRLDLTKVSISKALRDHSDISEETKEKVKKMAKEMGYRPNLVARSLTSQKTHTIGVIVPKVAHPFFSSVIEGVYQAALESDYEVVLGVTMEDEDLEQKHIESMLNMRVDGLLISISEQTQNLDNFDIVKDMEVDLVFYDRGFMNSGFTYVKVEDREGARKGVKHMIDQGFRNIAHLSGYLDDAHPVRRNIGSIGKDRNLGYRDALEEAGIEVDEKAVVEAGYSEDDGYNGFAQMLGQYGQPEAIFCVTYPVALGALQYMKDHNINPDDVALLSFGSSEFNHHLSHPIICIDQPAFQLGQRSFRQLILEIESDSKLNPEIISLESNILNDKDLASK
ncbi:LacI family DNA-binding transcriptional regulator [Fodinibius salsisoli]|uniref:LacI family DNA-binding transcriptional regulator n=1 Tax=Fodinibius salsisoli TaxID=2820877 RepID=A0ABT3PQU5_9BACT|nr:LacI family DNA-binding transcriptional regulator [Fodinibius salsisoli]MCW9708243.1 LacI family DNA-binding transcriptional regulator [Fodinibius salsisoli]